MNKPDQIQPSVIRIVRYDLKECQPEDEDGVSHIQEVSDKPTDRDDLIAKYNLPLDSIIKLKYKNKLIPWSLVAKCPSIEFQVFRPHQNIKPKTKENFSYDSLIREKVHRLEARIESLEQAMDPAVIDAKTEKDLELVAEQISLLTKRMELADQNEWIKKT